MRTQRAADYTNTVGNLRLELWHLGGRGQRARYRLRLTRRTGGRGGGYQNRFCDGDFRDLGQLVTALYWGIDDLVAGGELPASTRPESALRRRRRQTRPGA